MQLRKRSCNVTCTESPSTSNRRRRNYAQLEIDDESSDESRTEGSSGPENSDSKKHRISKKKPFNRCKRKCRASRDADRATYVNKRHGWASRDSASQTSREGESQDEDDNDFVAPSSKGNERKRLAGLRTRTLRSRKAKTVHFKDAFSSFEGREFRRVSGGSAEKSGRSYRNIVSEDDSHSSGESSSDETEASEYSRFSYRKKGASDGKLRRVDVPSIELTGCPAIDQSQHTLVVVPDVADDKKDGIVSCDKMYLSVDIGVIRAISPDEISSSKLAEALDAVEDQLNNCLTSNISPKKLRSFFVVDTFGLRISKDEYGPVSKSLSELTKVEKILAVRNRSAGNPIYCVKLQGKSYRNVVYVDESLLQSNSPQLLRNFLRRMDSLRRIDGHSGDHANSPAFSPNFLKVDRIVTVQKSGRGQREFLVKWCSLPYTEATWERQVDLVDDKAAIKRYSSFNRKVKKSKPPEVLSSKLVFNDGRCLRDYQEEGVSWLHDKFRNGVNCILADEMGLGKTIQAVAMLEALRMKHAIWGPFLVVAPVSALGHWQREVESLTDMNCVVYSGSAEDREIIRSYEFNYVGDSKSADMKFNVLLTSFEMVMKDQKKLAKIKWQYIVFDEAHRLKSKDSKTSHSVKQMSVARGGLLLLTGTPVQNNTKEIFSLLNLLDSEQFESEEEFLDKYGDLKNAEQVKDLQDNVLRPRLLRRMKEDVEKTIPQKEETIVWVELTRQQWVYYRAIYEKSIGVLLKGSSGHNIPSLRNVAMELRKVCNHPLLCDGVEDDLITKHNISKYGCLKVEKDQNLTLKLLQQSSGKMVLVDKLLPMLKEAGRRILIFSQFTMMLDLLEEYLILKGYTFERIDGNVRGTDRQAAIDRFSAKESDRFVFLLSTRAGGLGITLTAADTCLIYDSDWNPQNDLQAMARCHRIGQTKDVKVYRLITRNTYEQNLFECASRKYGLDEAILGNHLGADGDLEQAVNIESLLRNGAYDMMKDDVEASAAEFSAQNIQEILEQRTQKRLIGGRGVNTFSVATFISQSEMEQDPLEERKQHLEKTANEFWHDLLPEACKASEAALEKVLLVPSGSRRIRAQMRVNYSEDFKATSEDDETHDNTAGSEVESLFEESSVAVESEDEDVGGSWFDR